MRIQAGLSIAGLLLLVSSCSAGSTLNSPVGAGGGSGVGGPATGATSGGSGTPGASCAFGQTSCSGVCTTTATDLRNCGSCGTACGNGQSCTSGACACTAGLSACGPACVNTN